MENEKKAFCEYCEKEETYSTKAKDEETVVRGVKVTSEVIRCFCATCKHEIFVNDVVDLNLKKAYEAYKLKTGMVTGDEIRALREEHNISAVALSRLIGAGDKTITRYENGAIQDPVYDRILHLLTTPKGFCDWLEANQSVLSKEELEKVRYIHAEKATVNPSKSFNSSDGPFYKKIIEDLDKKWKKAEKNELSSVDSQNASKSGKGARA